MVIFPTVDSPNPEEPEALKMAIRPSYNDVDGHIVIGTDPDSDRIGVVAVRNLRRRTSDYSTEIKP